MLIKALGRAAAIGIDNVAKGFIHINKKTTTKKGQNLQEEDSAKESGKQHLEIEEPEGNRQFPS